MMLFDWYTSVVYAINIAGSTYLQIFFPILYHNIRADLFLLQQN